MKTAFFICAFVGVLLSASSLFAPYHEECHKHAANLQGIEAVITGWSSTWIAEPTPFILKAGYTGEVVLSCLLFLISFFIFTPHNIGWRNTWSISGFFIGYATWSWVYPLLFRTVDFYMVPQWTGAMKESFFYWPGILVVGAWVLCLIFRLNLRLK